MVRDGTSGRRETVLRIDGIKEAVVEGLRSTNH